MQSAGSAEALMPLGGIESGVGKDDLRVPLSEAPSLFSIARCLSLLLAENEVGEPQRGT